LKHKIFAIAVDDEAGQQIAFSVNKPVGPGIANHRLPVALRCFDSGSNQRPVDGFDTPAQQA
jgi:hypothetical protein